VPHDACHAMHTYPANAIRLIAFCAQDDKQFSASLHLRNYAETRTSEGAMHVEALQKYLPEDY